MMPKNTLLYILDKHGEPVLATSYKEYGEWRKFNTWIVGRTMVGKVRVSTVFLGIEHSMGFGRPQWFETMIFDGPRRRWQGKSRDFCERYETISDARIGHRRAVAMVTAEVKPGWWTRLKGWWKK